MPLVLVRRRVCSQKRNYTPRTTFLGFSCVGPARLTVRGTVRQTDGRTDRQTDRQTRLKEVTVSRPRLRPQKNVTWRDRTSQAALQNAGGREGARFARVNDWRRTNKRKKEQNIFDISFEPSVASRSCGKDRRQNECQRARGERGPFTLQCSFSNITIGRTTSTQNLCYMKTTPQTEK